MRKRFLLAYLLILILGSGPTWAADTEPAIQVIPDGFTITIDGTKIHGWLDKDGIDRPAFPWKPEGFYYRNQGYDSDNYKVTAWSSKGRAGRILSMAEDKILDFLLKAARPDDSPVGYATSDRKAQNPPRQARKYPPELTVVESPEGLKAQVGHSSVSANKKTKSVEELNSPSPKPTVNANQKTDSNESGSAGWPWWWWLLVLLLLFLLAWPLRALILRLLGNGG